MVKKGLVFISILAVLFLTANFALAQQETDTKAKAEWTFMVFLNGDNDLDPFGEKDLTEMKRIGSTPAVNVIVLQDRFKKPARKFIVNKGAIQILEEVGEVDMGDYKELVKFVKWAHEKYPAKKYMVDIWNHGAGWKKSRAEKVFKGISYDDQSGNHISTPQLGVAMQQIKSVIGHNVDVLGMDACLMQMMEVGYEVRSSVDYIAASEETEPGNGWPYDLVLGPLVKNPAMSGAELAILTVQAYKKGYSSNLSENTTQSAVDCSKFDAVCAKLDDFASAMTAKLGDAKIKAGLKKAAKDVQVYAYDDNCDLGHFCQLVNANVKDDAINKAATELLAVLLSAPSKLVLANSITGPGGVKDSTGLAIYLPRQSVAPNYKGIMLGKTAWATFISAFLR